MGPRSCFSLSIYVGWNEKIRVQRLLCLALGLPVCPVSFELLPSSRLVNPRTVIADAFDHNRIRYIRIDAIGKKSNPVHEFETNPELQVLLLHGYVKQLYT